MNQIEKNEKLISPCGFYCGACKSFLKGKCHGCETNTSNWSRKCKVKLCCKENNHQTCAECGQYSDVKECKKLNSLFTRFFAVFVGYDRPGSIRKIKEDGYSEYAKQMAQNKTMWIKRK